MIFATGEKSCTCPVDLVPDAENDECICPHPNM